jgi:hypothetical protein
MSLFAAEHLLEHPSISIFQKLADDRSAIDYEESEHISVTTRQKGIIFLAALRPKKHPNF